VDSRKGALVVQKESPCNCSFLSTTIHPWEKMASQSDKMAPNMGLQLFPPPPTKKQPPRKLSTRRNGETQLLSSAPKVERAKNSDLPDDRQLDRILRQTIPDDAQSISKNQQLVMDGMHTPTAGPSNNPYFRDSVLELPRSQTSFSDAPTLVRSQSNASRSSMTKPRLSKANSQGEPRTMRSIFPQYNPDIPLEHQPYYPTQASPSHIPMTVINKAPYSPDWEARSQQIRSHLSAASLASNFPRGLRNIVPKPLNPSSTEELKALWKVTNGWRVSPSEGRSFCLKMDTSVEMPVHTLSSATQPFYTLRLNPTSTSALLTMTRHDPNKSKGSSSPKQCSGLEILATTLEEPARRLPPNDGLIALLYPRSASTMALDLSAKANADKPAIMAAAEHECARLVWDHDTEQYYLVHPAMSTPFRITIESSPAWSRVEYILEHPQLPQNLAKLTRDGSGGGFLEIHSGVAATIESFYIADVAVCAVMLVAIEEESMRNIEKFEAPPCLRGLPSPKLAKANNLIKIKEIESDLESQDSPSDRKGRNDQRQKLPAPTRGILGLLRMLFKVFVWGLTVFVNAVASLIIAVSNRLSRW